MIIGRIGKQEVDLYFWNMLYFVLGIQLLTMLILGLIYFISILGLALLLGA